MRWLITMKLFLLTLLAGCSMMDSALLPSHASHTEANCASNLGAYYLPKTYLKVVVARVTVRTKNDKAIVDQYNEIQEVKQVRKPDRSQGYCLDYLASPTAKEKIGVVRNKDFLFEYITTESLDQSGYILKTLIRSLFIGLSGNKDFTPFRFDEATHVTARHIVFEAEYDPFDVKQSAMMNDALTPFQLCLVLENHTFDPRAHTINSYCNHPKSVIKKEVAAGSYAVDKLPDVRKHARGIVYRPRLPYNLYAFTRSGAKGNGAKAGHHGHSATWSLAATEIVLLENEAPNLVIGIERTFFSNRRATLVFDDGWLKNVCIHKTSELLQLSEIPLEIAGSIAALPTNILQVRIENTTNHKNLVAAEQQLIQTQMKHLEFLKDPAKTYAPAGTERTTKTDKWTNLPNGTVPTDIAPHAWPRTSAASGAPEWNICPTVSARKETLLPSFTDATNGTGSFE